MSHDEDRPFDLDELRVRTHRLAIDLPEAYTDYFTHVIEALGRLEAEIRTRADLCTGMRTGMDQLSLARTEAAALRERQQELLVTIRNLSTQVPYEEESRTAATLIAEVGTLRSANAGLREELAEGVERVQRAEAERIAAYLDHLRAEYVTEWHAWAMSEHGIRASGMADAVGRAASAIRQGLHRGDAK